MKLAKIKMLILTCILTVAFLLTVVPGCQPSEPIESYLAVIPKVLRSGSMETLSLTLFTGEKLASDRVEVSLLQGGAEITQIKQRIDGKGIIELAIPDIEEGTYEVKISGTGFEDKAAVKVVKSFLTFIETDKPIYKPGQTMQMRVVTLDTELKPRSELVTVEVLDAKGIKIFRRNAETDDFGMASLELPISTEPNLGVWKIKVVTEDTKSEIDVRVEKYVLPKYEVNLELPKQWFLVNEPIIGTISANYSFGKPVQGEIEITALRYVGDWEEYARFTKAIDGETDFELPAAGYVAGVPSAQGMGNVRLEITIREKATGYEESTSQLLTITESPVNIQIIPESSVFKPGLPFTFMVITETPDNQPVEQELELEITYLDEDYQEITQHKESIKTDNGKSVIEVEAPKKSVVLIIDVFSEAGSTSQVIEASYSPSGNFIHVEQTSQGIPEIGEPVTFYVHSTQRAVNFYYEIVARGKVIFSQFTKDREITIDTTPLMAPAATLLVYQILPNSEVVADYIPFKVKEHYPHQVEIVLSSPEASPGDTVQININAEGETSIGLAAVDKSVFILAENRLNLQQVFDELERLYMEPQAELHEVSIYPSITTQGAKDIFDAAGVVVLSNNDIPEGEEHQWEGQSGFWDRLVQFFGGDVAMVAEADAGALKAPGAPAAEAPPGLAEVERIRQYFPETWLWQTLLTDTNGKISLETNVPDTITTWMLRAVAISKDKGLGVSENELVVFQPFFVKVDLPYSAIRGEEFPVEVAIYNYLDEPQEVFVTIDDEDWFDLLDISSKVITIAANDIGSVKFRIRAKQLGINELKITAQSKEVADAIIKTVIIQPEGVPREEIENLTLSNRSYELLDTSIPFFAVTDSGRALLTLTSSYLTQTLEGLEALIQMPFGCGEQNMILLAPNIYVTSYLQESGQLKPEIMAKAEKLMITGYQRELTYRRHDGSFSAFGQNDDVGSLWLTAFVLKSFAQAQSLIYIDDSVLSDAADWIISHQNQDGSFDPVGFVHHQEMLGGLTGKNALTAYTLIALLEADAKTSADKAISYLEGQLNNIDDPYTMAITAYALEHAGSDQADQAYEKLMELAIEDEDGLHWGDSEEIIPSPTRDFHHSNRSATIETTAYATLALIKHGDNFNASRAAKWLVSRRNAYGGFGSTQDTVVALQALTEYSSDTRADVNLNVTITTDEMTQHYRITQENFDVLQVIEIPINQSIEISAEGHGEAIAQLVKRFNLPEAEPGDEILTINVEYDTTEIEVNDLVTVSVEVGFNPPMMMEAGMVVLDISVPTGFTPVNESIDNIIDMNPQMKRYDISGRKVIFYIENMLPGDTISFNFQVRAMYPVKAKGVTSQVYSYYKPEIKGESLSQDITIN